VGISNNYRNRNKRFIKRGLGIMEWRPFAHFAIDHQPLTALEQWKASRYGLL